MQSCIEIHKKLRYNVRLYKHLQTLIFSEIEFLMDDRVDEMNKVVKVREQLMKEISATDESIRVLYDRIFSDERITGTQKTEVDRLVESLRVAVNETMSTISESRNTLSLARNGIAAELQTLSNRRKAVNVYSMNSNMVLHK